MRAPRFAVPVLALALAAAPLALALPNPAPAAAQGRGGGMGMGQRGVEMMLEGITLSKAQRARVDSIAERWRGEMMKLRQAGGPPDRAAMMALMEKRDAEIRAALPEKDRATFDRNRAAMRERMRERRG